MKRGFGFVTTEPDPGGRLPLLKLRLLGRSLPSLVHTPCYRPVSLLPVSHPHSSLPASPAAKVTALAQNCD
jgi:hypothetical protein